MGALEESWDEQKHPRVPLGSSAGGEFAATDKQLAEIGKKYGRTTVIPKHGTWLLDRRGGFIGDGKIPHMELLSGQPWSPTATTSAEQLHDFLSRTGTARISVYTDQANIETRAMPTKEQIIALRKIADIEPTLYWDVATPGKEAVHGYGTWGRFDEVLLKVYGKRKASESGTLQEASGSSSFDPDINDPDLIILSEDMALPSDSVTLQIDSALDGAVWNGTTFEDRTVHATSLAARDLVTEMERSLMQQESYDDFADRMLGEMGVDTSASKGVLGGLINQLKNESRLAWNTSMVAANDDEDTIIVSESVLDPVTTTQECWDRHGVPLEDIGETMPYHWGCKCGPRTIPNPNSTNPDWAALGQQIMEEMAAERDG